MARSKKHNPSNKTRSNSQLPYIEPRLLAGANNTCLITNKKGMLRCWGNTEFNQTNIPPAFQASTLDVSIGIGHVCAISNEYELMCWGFNGQGQCGVPPNQNRDVFVLSLGSFFTCALKLDNEWSCWGLEDQVDVEWHRELFSGMESLGDHLEILNLDAGGMHVCVTHALIEENLIEGRLVVVEESTTYEQFVENLIFTTECFGSNQDGQSEIPQFIKTEILILNLGQKHTCSITNVGKLYCFGKNDQGQSTVPGVNQLQGHRWQQVATGSDHNCGFQVGGHQECWGNDGSGQLNVYTGLNQYSNANYEYSGNATQNQQDGQIEIEHSEHSEHRENCDQNCRRKKRVVNGRFDIGFILAAGGEHTCAMSEYGSWVGCWGQNSDKQCDIPVDRL